MESNQNDECSRRERHRRDTWKAIHDEAYAIAAEAGPAAVTIEAVAERAGISRRTFFNYFATKEDAILGVRPPAIDPGDLEAFRTGGEDLLTRAVRLLAGTLALASLDGSFVRRRELVRKHPELRDRSVRLVADIERQVAEAVRADGEYDGDAGRALLVLAGAITRFAISRYQHEGPENLDGYLTDAVALFRSIAVEGAEPGLADGPARAAPADPAAPAPPGVPTYQNAPTHRNAQPHRMSEETP
ncbi:TetR/AcrR family transcriptional regulator [Zhihengliuella alba]|uniref:TetR/AcrR family transcriptional regulator n=1 Tax=Zhihengliuella alba TaxID=547018 RepID=UPI0031E8DA67